MTSVTISPELRRLVAESRQNGEARHGSRSLQNTPSNKLLNGSSVAAQRLRPRLGADRKPISKDKPLVALRVRRSGQRPLEDLGMAMVEASSSGNAGQGRFHLRIYETKDQGFVMSIEHGDDAHQRHLVSCTQHATVDELADTVRQLRPEDHIAWPRLPLAAERNTTSLEGLSDLRKAVRAEFDALIAESLPALFIDQPEHWRSS